MKLPAFILLAVSVPGAVKAQIPVNDAGILFGGELSAEVEKRLTSSVKVFAEGEIRLSDTFLSQERYTAGLGVSCKLNPYLKTAARYTFIEKRQHRSGFSPRHRVSLEAAGLYRTGAWKFSLEERLQLTHRAGSMNPYQQPRNALALKSRVKAEYRISKQWSPYISAELRCALNAPSLQDFRYDAAIRKYVTPSGAETGGPGWFLRGFDDVDFNRIRGVLGLRYRLNRQHTFRFYSITDYRYELDIDANRSGTRLKSLVYNPSFSLLLGAGYGFSF